MGLFLLVMTCVSSSKLSSTKAMRRFCSKPWECMTKFIRLSFFHIYHTKLLTLALHMPIHCMEIEV